MSVNDGGPAREGLTPKEAWWAGARARAGLGLDPDTPRELVASALAAVRRGGKSDLAEWQTDAMRSLANTLGGNAKARGAQ